MNTAEILSAIDHEISRLTQVRSLLDGLHANIALPERVASDTPRRRGRPKGSTNKSSGVKSPGSRAPRRTTMSPEGKARIAAAQRARWARQHAEAETKSEPKQTKASPKTKRSGGTRKASAKSAAVKAAQPKANTRSNPETAPKKGVRKSLGASKTAKRTASTSPQRAAGKRSTAPKKTLASNKANAPVEASSATTQPST